MRTKIDPKIFLSKCSQKGLFALVQIESVPNRNANKFLFLFANICHLFDFKEMLQLLQSGLEVIKSKILRWSNQGNEGKIHTHRGTLAHFIYEVFMSQILNVQQNLSPQSFSQTRLTSPVLLCCSTFLISLRKNSLPPFSPAKFSLRFSFFASLLSSVYMTFNAFGCLSSSFLFFYFFKSDSVSHHLVCYRNMNVHGFSPNLAHFQYLLATVSFSQFVSVNSLPSSIFLYFSAAHLPLSAVARKYCTGVKFHTVGNIFNHAGNVWSAGIFQTQTHLLQKFSFISKIKD